MDAVKTTRILIIGIFVFAIGFVTFAIFETRKQSQLEAALAQEGQGVVGRIVGKSQSDPSDSSSVPISSIIEVEYVFAGNRITNPYSVDRSRYEELSVGDAIELTVLPDRPRLSQLTEYIGQPLNYRGFVPLD